ncbi:SMI1/KNR4 family protein [Yoonia sp. 2307UL14-13]|uniref:SMI1/KNR4 family protein n=1 Tax=Yoonia sp. 2307UL14-13 TaxID=3126506 RepID=UPI0030AAB78D
MKIIPESPTDPETLTKILQGNETPSLKHYKQFMLKYGGGHIFPNTVKLKESIILEGPLRMFAVQYFHTADRIETRSGRDLIMRDFSAPFICIAVEGGGDEIIISLDPSDIGAIWFWSSYGTDGIHGTKRRIADSFAHLLKSFAYYEDEGKTPPWNRMASVDDDPAVDLVLDL